MYLDVIGGVNDREVHVSVSMIVQLVVSSTS